jgi:hypothetical protein
MKVDINLEETIRKYLLGSISQAEQEKLEERLMTEDDVFTQVLVHEDELIEEYLGGSLSALEREAFERHFLAAPERRQKLGFARALTKYVNAPGRTRDQVTQPTFYKAIIARFRIENPVVQYAFAAIALMLTVGIPWSILNVWKLQTEIGKIRDNQATSQIAVNNLTQQLSEAQKRSQDLMEQLGQQQQSRTALEEQLASIQQPATVSFPLTPGLVRDFGVMKKLVVPPTAKLVELGLSVDGESYTNYRAMLLGVSGEEVLSLNRLNGTRRDGIGVVVMPIPAGLLGPGDFIVKLSGLKPGGSAEDIGKYYFHVSKK